MLAPRSNQEVDLENSGKNVCWRQGLTKKSILKILEKMYVGVKV